MEQYIQIKRPGMVAAISQPIFHIAQLDNTDNDLKKQLVPVQWLEGVCFSSWPAFNMYAYLIRVKGQVQNV